jgi:hypothetical protein
VACLAVPLSNNRPTLNKTSVFFWTNFRKIRQIFDNTKLIKIRFTEKKNENQTPDRDVSR